MTDWGKRVFGGALVGAVLGVLLGLGLARVLWPPPEPTPLATPLPTVPVQEATPTPTVVAQPGGDPDQAVVVISALYALDGDLERARQRLAALELDNPERALVELALHHASAGNQQVATDLATLAADLGLQVGELVAYVVTSTPTPTPTSSPTSTPAPTSTPSPLPSSTPLPTPTASAIPTRRPAAAQPPTARPASPSATPLPWDWWDRRVDLLSPPVHLLGADVKPGERYWRLVRLEWWKPSEGGNTLLYVTTLREDGQPKWGQEVIIENGGRTSLYTTPKPGEPYGLNFPMSSTLNSYQAYVGGDLPSDRVVGLGLGEGYGGKDHTTFVLVFQLSRK